MADASLVEVTNNSSIKNGQPRESLSWTLLYHIL